MRNNHLLFTLVFDGAIAILLIFNVLMCCNVNVTYFGSQMQTTSERVSFELLTSLQMY